MIKITLSAKTRLPMTVDFIYCAGRDNKNKSLHPKYIFCRTKYIVIYCSFNCHTYRQRGCVKGRRIGIEETRGSARGVSIMG